MQFSMLDVLAGLSSLGYSVDVKSITAPATLASSEGATVNVWEVRVRDEDGVLVEGFTLPGVATDAILRDTLILVWDRCIERLRSSHEDDPRIPF